MQTTEINFTEAATPEMKSALLGLIERAASLDEIFEEWFVKQGNRFSLGLAEDDDDTLMPDSISLCFDLSDRTEILSAFVERSELARLYPLVAPFNIFVKGWGKQSPLLQLHEMKYQKWLKRIGFGESDALMCRTGSRSAAMQLMVSFALSGRGFVEAWHIDPKDPFYEDYELDLAEEGIDLKDYFMLHAGYEKRSGLRCTGHTLFDPFYCKKAA